MDENRKAFEAWAKDRGQGIDRDGGGGDGYYWPSVHNAWVGWQAAWTASRALALEEAREKCDSAAKRINALAIESDGPIRSVVLAGNVAVCQELAAAIRAISRGADKE